MVMGEIGREYALAIIGGGPAGYMAAIRAGQLGINTVLIEKEEIGGECLNRGCIPSKMLLNISGILHLSEQLSSVGIKTRVEKVDMKKMQKENTAIISRLRNGVNFLLKSYGVDVLQGEAKFESSDHILIQRGNERESIRFRNALIATGSLTNIPQNIKIGKKIITSREALFLDKIPKKIAIIGAGYVAAELGTFFSEMGSQVSLLARSRLLSRFDEDLVSEFVKSKNEQLRIYENCAVHSLKDTKEGAVVKFTSSGAKKMQTLKADKVIIAIGKIPNTKNIGLENTKVKLDSDGFIEINERMQTADPNIYAAGDCTKGPMLAHKAFMQGFTAAEVIAGIKSAAFEPRVIPEIVFTHPEIVVVGMSEQKAKQMGYDIKITKFPLTALGGAVATLREKGFVKIIHDKEGRILGIGIVGKGVSELAGEAALAIEMNAYLDDIAAIVHAHPTMYESLHEAAELALGKPMHGFLKK